MSVVRVPSAVRSLEPRYNGGMNKGKRKTYLIKIVLTSLRIVNRRLIPVMIQMACRNEAVAACRRSVREIQQGVKYNKPTVVSWTASNQNPAALLRGMDFVH